MSKTKKDIIVLAAFEQFMKYGFKKVNMGDIASAADISRPALYLLFCNKEDIFKAVIRWYFERARGNICADLDGFHTVQEKLRFIFQVLMVESFDDIMKSREARELVECGFGFAAETVDEAFIEVELIIADVLRPVALSVPPEKTAQILTSAVRGFKMVAKNSQELGAMVDDMIALLLNA